MIFAKRVFLVMFSLILAGSVCAQITTPGGLTSTPTQQIVIQQPPLQTPQPPEPPQQPLPPRTERSSDFEQFITDKAIEISETQFGILKKLDGVSFQYSPRNIIRDRIVVPVRIVKAGQARNIVDAGFITGTPVALSNAFKLVGIKSPVAVSTEIEQFGYELFRQSPSAFMPSYRVPVGPDYVIGPGDEIKITLWGNIEGQFSTVVDRDGHINLPKAGIIGVTGLTFKELKELLLKELSKYYTNFEMNVSMGALRTIRVYVVGNAERPGSYAVSSLSTLVNALFESGGASKTGSLRDIQLKRGGKVVVHFDAYDLLLRGDKTKDVRLVSEDVIYIPPVGPLVAIAGSVNNPAIYELKNEKTVSQVIEIAGGLNAVAFHGRVQIERIVDNNRQVVFESDLSDAKTKEMTLRPGDMVKVYQVIQDKRTIRLSGAVQREGTYGFTPGMTIRDLINMSGGLKYYAYTKEAELTRLSVLETGPKTEKITIDLEKALSGDKQNNITLQENDYIFIRPIPEWQTNRTITVQGEVKFPGTYPIGKGERLASVLERAGGYTDRAYLRSAIFTRERVRELQQKNLDELVARLEREILSVSSGQIATATTQEEVQARKAEAEQKQKFIESLKRLRATGRLTIRLGHLRLLKGSEYDIELEDGDNLYIPMLNNVVNVAGSVMTQGSFVYSENLSYKDYIDMSGGYTRYADESNIYILKVDGSAMKPKGSIFWNSNRSRWELTAFGETIKEVEPGDTVVVPEKIERVAWLRDIKDITQILANVALTAGVFKALY